MVDRVPEFLSASSDPVSKPRFRPNEASEGSARDRFETHSRSIEKRPTTSPRYEEGLVSGPGRTRTCDRRIMSPLL